MNEGFMFFEALRENNDKKYYFRRNIMLKIRIHFLKHLFLTRKYIDFSISFFNLKAEIANGVALEGAGRGVASS